MDTGDDMSFNFPDSPADGEEYSPIAGVTYVFEAPHWIVKAGTTISGITAGNGLTGGGTSGVVTLSLDTPVSVVNGGSEAATPAGAATNLSVLPLSGGVLSGDISANSLITKQDAFGYLKLGRWSSGYTGAPVNCVDTAGGGNHPTFFSVQFNSAEKLSLLNDGTLIVQGANATKPGGGSWVAPSDTRLKREVTKYERGLDQVIALQPIIYQYNGKGGLPDDGRRFCGLDAGATELVMPELVGSMLVTWDAVAPSGLPSDTPKLPDTEIKTIDSTPLLFALVNACKELAARVAALESMVAGNGR